MPAGKTKLPTKAKTNGQAKRTKTTKADRAAAKVQTKK